MRNEDGSSFLFKSPVLIRYVVRNNFGRFFFVEGERVS